MNGPEDTKSIISELGKLREENARLVAGNELLRRKVDLPIRKVFGAGSKKIDLEQLLLFDPPEAKKPEGDGPAPEVEPSPSRKRTRRASREATLPADLPVEETVLIPDEVREHPGTTARSPRKPPPSPTTSPPVSKKPSPAARNSSNAPPT